MPFTARVDHARRFVLFLDEGLISQADLDRVIRLFRHPDYPADYDIITVFAPDVRFTADIAALVAHAVERRRTLQERPHVRMVRSALVNPPTDLGPSPDLWGVFFPEEEGALQVRSVTTVAAALTWLGHPRDLDVAALPALEIVDSI
jgi:hypothetical protein